ncbi:MAG: hypothetical protein H8D72_02355 [Planctomycetes bacterium]|nr:hypothetical protein [Planctomycetota bacterium]
MLKSIPLLMLLSLAGDPKEFEVQPKTLAWSELSPDVFDRQWILPEPRTVPGRDLLAEMRALLALRFDFEDTDGRRYRNFGDLAAAARSLDSFGPRAAEQRERWYAGIERAAPDLTKDWGAGLRQLLFDQGLHGSRWKPSKETDDDGLLFADSWKMQDEKSGPWGDLDVRPLMEQGAALMFADLATIKAVENDYRVYPNNVDADYEEVYPVPGSYYRGKDQAERPFSALTIRFTCDLPFPFSDYSTKLGILNRFDDAGVLYTDIFSTSSDFYWLAGRDVFLPVTNSDGEWVAFLLVRHFGFDLDGVPDGADDRRVALGSSMGNLKRNAERLWRTRLASATEPVQPENGLQVLDQVRVFGRK